MMMPLFLENTTADGGRLVAPDTSSTLADVGPIPADAIVVLPVRNMVMFPGIVVPIAIGRERSVAAAQYAAKMELPIGILMQHNPEAQTPEAADLSSIGTMASILRYVTTPDGTHHIICQGQQRFHVIGFVQGYPFMVAKIERLTEVSGVGDQEIEARMLQLKERAAQVLQLLPQVSDEMVTAVRHIETPGILADLVAGYLDIKASEKQELLEEIDLRKRLDRLLALVTHRIEVIRISREIEESTRANLDKREREFLLREQMKAIQKELGEDSPGNSAEMADLRKQIDEAQMPHEVHRQAEKELRRLERMSDVSAEYSMVRTYLDWLAELPWKSPEPDVIDVVQAGQVLDADHFGLAKVKERVLEYLAVRKLKPGGHGPILCLVGPPGVGKTSLGQSIAKALGQRSRSNAAKGPFSSARSTEVR